MDRDVLQIISTEGSTYDSRASDFMLLYNNCKIRIDPSKSFYERLIKERRIASARKEFERQQKLTDKTDILIISHFHDDHVSGVDFLEYFDKAPISIYQKFLGNTKRNRRYLKILEEKTNHMPINNYLYISDYRGIEMEFREFDHGRYKGFNLGKVIMSYFNNKREIIITSDVSGPEFDNPTNYIIEKDPDMLVLDGPFNYLDKVRPFSHKDPKKAKKVKRNIEKEIDKSYNNLKRIIKKTEKLNQILLIHHFMRNMNIDELMSSERFLSVEDISRDYGVKIYLPGEIKKDLIKF